ncbi:PREDICTED: uncharacterized protein LOC109187796 [Ipomoea nil]|uniref:uncharacterized protein LOC109187796 n=1 Tax=Ipomoea nil TaxID=35883 RepID=UPI0009009B03|nr:PREDICTED: uncharacterized protein LOC109187796 [Ipomoea nil]
MGSLFVLAKDLNTECYTKAIRLRLVRIYDVHEGRNTSIIKSQELLFHDSEYKLTPDNYMIKLNHQTTVLRHRRKGFAKCMFRLRSFDDILGRKIPEKLLFDVIGRVVEFYPLKSITIGGYPSKLVDFIIEDSKNNRIKCTVWDSHVDDVLPYFTDNVDGPIIILMQLCRAKHLDTKVRISSSYNATKVWINHDCPEFEVFKDSLNDQQTPIRSMTNVSTFSYPNSQEYSSKRPMIVSTIADIYRGLSQAITMFLQESMDWRVPENGTTLLARKKDVLENLSRKRHYFGVTPAKLVGNWEFLGLSAYDLRNKYLEV